MVKITDFMGNFHVCRNLQEPVVCNNFSYFSIFSYVPKIEQIEHVCKRETKHACMLQPNEESLLALIGGSIGVELSLCMLGRLDSLHVICIHPQTDHATGTVTQDIKMEL